MSSRRRRGERASGTALTAGVMLIVMVMAGLLLLLAGYVAAMHHVRAAADLVALSGANAQLRGQDPCKTAAAMAVENGVRVKTCRLVGDSFDFAVKVIVAGEVAAPAPGLPDEVSAAATAGRLGLLR